ncbi:Innexin [Cinara cedri]|uniref:Innexin n=1 Tax=Cinara cedri TaxID=506608 RepID=A0A5E4M383_9HEMI|nr:Innexin [Cinara cedri]
MGILSLFSILGNFVAVRNLVDKAIIDNLVFRAHYKITAMIFFAFSMLVTANSYVGEPIMCMSDDERMDQYVTTYCWVTTTFTLPIKSGQQAIYPGVASYSDESKHDVKYHAYYQWVPYILVLQGLMFYSPHWIWKILEGRKIGLITEGIRGNILGRSEEKMYVKNLLVKYLICKLNMHNIYAFGYFFCEVLNFVNVIGNIFLIDWFLGGEFLTYGLKVLEFSQMEQENRTDPMVAIFPKMTKCTFHKYGPSGTIQSRDYLCLLAVNNLNEKIYIGLWFWLLILAVFSGLILLYSMALCMMPKFRKLILRRRFKFGSNKLVSKLIDRFQIGDFLVVHFLGQNLDNINFNDVMTELCCSLHMIDEPLNESPSNSILFDTGNVNEPINVQAQV